ncbi:MAG TPA: 50S ribosomal protein L13 [Firmicutes bacterium]|nr:50S ribosomal protein L13 [Bacillota bacterium]
MATYGKGTYTVSGKDIKPSWYVVDAEERVLGRLASQIARVLKGKHRPDYSPHLDLGDRVIVVNAAKLRLTGKKLEQKTYFRHSGYPGGAKFTSLSSLMENDPAKVIEFAVQGMLPKGKLGRELLRKLRVYAGPENPHIAQNPEPLPEM